MTHQKLSAIKREVVGRKVNRLRNQGILPANIFGSDIDSQAVQIDLKEFQKVFSEAGETGLIDIMIGEEKRPVLVSEIQYDPQTDAPLHVDFRQVNLKEEVTANVPVELTGESPAEKQGIGTVVQIVNEIEVSALPDKLPSAFTVDISNLTEVDQQITLSDLGYDKEHVKIDVENPEEYVIVKVDELTKEEAPVEVAPAEGVEGETPSETTPATEETSSDEKKE